MSIKNVLGLAGRSSSAIDITEEQMCQEMKFHDLICDGMSREAATQTVKEGGVRLDHVLAYKNKEIVLRFIKKLKLSEKKAIMLFEDMLRFLWMCGTNKGKGLVPPIMIDKAWHEFLMFTEDYQKFCQQNFGHFIHHRPNRSDDPPSDGSEVSNSKAIYAEHLGADLSKNWGVAVCRCVGSQTNCKSNCYSCTKA